MKANFNFIHFFKSLFNRSKKNEHHPREIQFTKQEELIENNDEYDEVSDHELEEFAESTLKEIPRPSKSELDSIPQWENELEQLNESATDDGADIYLENPEELDSSTLKSSDKLAMHELENDVKVEEHGGQDSVPFQYTEFPSSKKQSLKDRFHLNFFKRNGNSKDHFAKHSSNKKEQHLKFKSSFSQMRWTEIVQKIFSPYSRKRIHQSFLLAFILVMTYFAGKGIAYSLKKFLKIDEAVKMSNVQTPINQVSDTSASDLQKISSTNLFDIKDTEEDKVETPKIDIDAIVCEEATRPSTVPVKLVDTIVLQDSVKSIASVQVRAASEMLYLREGERIDSTAEISKIERMKVVIKNLSTGECEYIKTDHAEPEELATQIKVLPAKMASKVFKSLHPKITNEGNNFKIKKAFRDEMLSKISDVLTQAKAIQITNPDGSLCFKMTEITPGSPYSLLNIQENDVICSIDGRKIENLNELMNMLGRIKEINSLQLSLKRGGVEENLQYQFVN